MSVDEQLLIRHHVALQRLSRSRVWLQGGRDAAFAEAIQVAAEMLEVDRIGVWLYGPRRASIVGAALYDRRSDALSSGLALYRQDYPRYFQALEEERTIAAEDARSDPRTSEFTADYLEPNGIGSMLDAPVLIAGRSVGVVCHEHVGGPRSWTAAELLLAASIADFVALAIQADEQRRTQALLERRQAELQQALDAADMGIWTWDITADTVDWSEQVGPLFGRIRGWQPRDYEDYLSRVHPDDRPAVAAAVSEALAPGGDDYYSQHRVFVDGDGAGEGVRWIEVSGRVERDAQGRPQRLLGTVQDISERRQLEAQLIQAQKLEAIGRLAGGVAHDFNNLLTAIGGTVDMVTMLREDDTELRRDLAQVFEATRRATALTQQLLAFVREQPTQPRVVDLNQLLAGLDGLIRRLIGEQIEVVDERCDEQTHVRADPTQLEQVFINLVVNARDAMADGGRLTITTRVAGEGEGVGGEGEGVEGEQVVVEIRDTGTGMSPEVARRAFEPFFTTKGAGRGTGLGLATCREIVERFAGFVTIDSVVDRGTTIWITLPRVRDPVALAHLEPVPEQALGGHGRVLLVEDDPAVRELAARILGHCGYEVEVAASRAQALALAAQRPVFDLLLADVVIPGGSGVGLGLELRAQGRVAAILLISGYAFDEAELPDGARFLAKPFTARALAAAVRRAVASELPAAG